MGKSSAFLRSGLPIHAENTCRFGEEKEDDKTREAEETNLDDLLRTELNLQRSEDWAAELLDLDEALQQLETDRPEAAELVKLRYFGGLKMADAAKLLGISERTAHRHWQYAKAWLYQKIN